jgi:ribosomal protein S6--L-glutamate ligase
MKTLVVINGEDYWARYFPEYEVHHRRLQTSRWLLRDSVMWNFDSTGAIRVDAVLWRLGAVRPHLLHRATLETVRLANVPCVNSAQTLLRGYDRLAMLSELREIGLPMLPFTVALGDRVLEMQQPELPAVVKIGNLHGGWGKARAENSEQWQDICDLAFINEEYATVEPYIDYAQDVRCLAVGDQA